jgi:hypothetical protein
MSRAKDEFAIAPETWTRLYSQAEKLRLLKPWKKLYDNDMFGVMDMESGQIVWFAVLGALGEMFSLAVYVGDAGLACYHKMISLGANGNPSHQIALNMNCMMVEFVSKKELTREDRETFGVSGFTPPARARVAQFRSTRPGYGPWLLDSGEAALLARVLPDAVEIIGRLLENHDLLGRESGEEQIPYFVREDAAGLRLKRFDIPEEKEHEPLSSFDFSEFEAARVRESAKPSDAEWHMGFMLMGGMIEGEDGRPFPAGAFLCMDVTSDKLFSPVVYQPDVPQGALAAKILLGAIRESGSIPASVLCEESEWLDGMLSIADALGIELFQGVSPILSKVGDMMGASMRSRNL